MSVSDLSIVEVTQADVDAANHLVRSISGGSSPATERIVQAFARHRASEAERVREACAKVAEDHVAIVDHVEEAALIAGAGRDIAAAIRSLPIGAVE